ncbi:MAG TPA: trypsin-like peptidase domain-containing protein [Fimbriimonadaceae bacterium]|nr:trypsin-like peptidase domain-containing protein [Fimbriimonadaceae bacterium]
MKPTTPLVKRASFWTLALGIAIGGGIVSSLKGIPGITSAMATPSVNQRLAGLMSADSMAALHSLDNSFQALAAAVEPAVVNIHVTAKGQPGNLSAYGSEEGWGSGVIIRSDGYIVTNDHVVNGMDSVTVNLTDGRSLPGKVIRGDGSEDIAVIKVNATNLPTLPFGDSNKVRPGQIAMAVGSPFNKANSVTVGHISALDRQNTVPDPRLPSGARGYPDLIQTDASINPGNSGGALVDIDGELVGINTMIASQSGTNSGVSFAIPSNEAKLLADMLIDKGVIKRAFMGVQPAPLTQIQQQQLGVTDGAYVTDVPHGTPGEKAGFQKGDVIVRVGSTPIVTFIDVRNCMYRYNPGDTVKVEVVRDGKHKTLDVKLGEVPPPPTVQRQQGRPFRMDPFGDNSPFQFRFPDIPDQGGSDGMDPRVQAKPVPFDGHLGVSIGPITDEARAYFHLPASAQGVVVDSVVPGSLADRIGLKAGDVISMFGGQKVTDRDALVRQIRASKVGDKGSITFERYSGGGERAMPRDFTFK